MRNQMKRAALILTAIGGLSACQKSACDYTPDSNRITAADQMLTCIDSLPATTAAQMPSSGSATYTGYFAGSITGGATDALFGDAAMTASFTGVGGSVTGQVTNITSTNNGTLTGTLGVTGGTISGALVTGAAISGGLSYSGSGISIAATMVGGFLGENAQGLLLVASDDVGSAGTVTGDVTGSIDIAIFGLN